MPTDEHASTRPEPIGFREWLTAAIRFRLPWIGASPSGLPRGRQTLISAVALVMVGAIVTGSWLVLRTPTRPDIATLLPRAGVSGVSLVSGVSGGDGAVGAAVAVAVASSAPPSALGASGASGAGAARVLVHVVGAVVASGVVQVPPGSRVLDAVAAAGGATPDADLARVNLAAKLSDGQRVVVPRIGEASPVVAVDSDGGDGGATPGADTTPVDLNNATAVQLDALPGVGPATAAAIVAHRTQHGPFRTVDALGDVKGIGSAKLEQLRPLVTV